jgi:hypothetical protein
MPQRTKGRKEPLKAPGLVARGSQRFFAAFPFFLPGFKPKGVKMVSPCEPEDAQDYYHAKFQSDGNVWPEWNANDYWHDIYRGWKAPSRDCNTATHPNRRTQRT